MSEDAMSEIGISVTEEDLMGLEEFMPRAEDVEAFVQGRQEGLQPLGNRATTRNRKGDMDSTKYGGKGWNARKSFERESRTFAQDFTVKDEEVLMKFLDEGPFWTYYRHWINAITAGRKSFTCLRQDCPLCEIDSPRLVSVFNVLDMSDPGNIEVKVWTTSPQPTDAIVKMAEDRRYKPINREDMYFAVSRSKGKNGVYTYALLPVKDRDLRDDYKIDPLSGLDIAKYKESAYDESAINVTDRETLREIVDNLVA
jgi:hypothetical protein